MISSYAEAATYTAHNKRKGRISVSSAGFKPAIPAIKRFQTYALDRTATGIGTLRYTNQKQKINVIIIIIIIIIIHIIEIQRMWNVKTKAIPVIIGATGTISNHSENMYAT